VLHSNHEEQITLTATSENAAKGVVVNYVAHVAVCAVSYVLCIY